MNLQRTSATAFGLVAWLEQTQIHLPLKAIECRFEASGVAVDVQIDQIFHQSARRPPAGPYSFPLPPKAPGHSWGMILNSRPIPAKAVGQEDALGPVEPRNTEGRSAGLVGKGRR